MYDVLIYLRDVKAESKDDIVKSLTSLRDIGFINYYGMQRFGTRSVPTHYIGKAMLAGKWEEAVNLILQPKLDGISHDNM